jgi:hypothetical protein
MRSASRTSGFGQTTTTGIRPRRRRVAPTSPAPERRPSRPVEPKITVNGSRWLKRGDFWLGPHRRRPWKGAADASCRRHQQLAVPATKGREALRDSSRALSALVSSSSVSMASTACEVTFSQYRPNASWQGCCGVALVALACLDWLPAARVHHTMETSKIAIGGLALPKLDACSTPGELGQAGKPAMPIVPGSFAIIAGVTFELLRLPRTWWRRH